MGAVKNRFWDVIMYKQAVQEIISHVTKGGAELKPEIEELVDLTVKEANGDYEGDAKEFLYKVCYMAICLKRGLMVRIDPNTREGQLVHDIYIDKV